MPWRIVFSAVVVIGVAVSVWFYLTRERALTIEAGALSATAPHHLKTSFTLRKPGLIAAVTGNYRRSHGMAGACMMANVSVIPAIASPANLAACTAALPSQDGVPDADKWAPYFIEGKCWFRGSGKTYCVKNSTHNNDQPWLEGTVNVPLQGATEVKEIYDEVRRQGVQGNFELEWRTEACLNPVDPADGSKDILTCSGIPGPAPLRDSGPVGAFR